MKRVFTLLLLLLLLMQQTFAQEDENLRLSNIKHNPLSITFTDQNGLYGFFDKQSGYYQPPIYDSIDDRCTDPLSPMFVKKDGLWGYVNRSNGEVVVPFQFSGGYGYPLYQNGYALIANRNPSDDGSITYQTYLLH